MVHRNLLPTSSLILLWEHQIPMYVVWGLALLYMCSYMKNVKKMCICIVFHVYLWPGKFCYHFVHNSLFFCKCFCHASNCFLFSFCYASPVLVSPALYARCLRVAISSPWHLVVLTPRLLAQLSHKKVHIVMIPHRTRPMITASCHKNAALPLWLLHTSHGLIMANWSVWYSHHHHLTTKPS